jgi:hypothetical protein
MARSQRERREAWERLEQSAAEIFFKRASAITTYKEADDLVDRSPGPSQPGRKYYSNLGFFLGQFTVPAGSSYSERRLYIELIERFESSGNLELGAAQRVITELRASMENVPYF